MVVISRFSIFKEMKISVNKLLTMLRFIFHTVWFLSPILALHLFTYTYYVTDQADLLKLGYIIDLYPHYHELFNREYQHKILYREVSEQPQQKDFTVLTIGDSFSELDGCGYKNYLAQNKGISVLHINRSISDNQIQTLYSLLNGDLFDRYHFQFVILENIERHITENIEGFDPNRTLTYSEMMEMNKDRKTSPAVAYPFLSDRVLKFPYYAVQYFVHPTFFFNEKVYKTALSKPVFSVGSTTLLFYHKDFTCLQRNNNIENVQALNKVLNDLNERLKQKGIQLIFLPAPDKYDLYYDYIIDQSLFARPLFFEHFDKMDKQYICIDSKKILSEAVKKRKDIYYYDDTHWSPWAAQLMATAIQQHIQVHQKHTPLVTYQK